LRKGLGLIGLAPGLLEPRLAHRRLQRGRGRRGGSDRAHGLSRKGIQAVTLSLRPVAWPWVFTNTDGLASGVFCATASLGLLTWLLGAGSVRLGTGVGATGELLTDATSMNSSGVESSKFMREGLAFQ
jgi:hypothetical protein